MATDAVKASWAKDPNKVPGPIRKPGEAHAPPAPARLVLQENEPGLDFGFQPSAEGPAVARDVLVSALPVVVPPRVARLASFL